jgi:processive 1,2-diacylglycerol beta-glucosyltransferase
MKKILILSSIWGHESIAKGARDALKGSGFKTQLEIIQIDPFSARSYKTFYKFAPGFFQSAFNLAKYKVTGRVLDKYFEASYLNTIEKLIKGFRPDVVISSYFGFDSSIEKLKVKYKFHYLNIVADPWTFTRIHTSKNTINLVFDEKSKEKAENYVRAGYVASTGWFVEDKYNTRLKKEKALKIIGVEEDKFTICVTGGSEGTFDVLKIVNSFIGRKRNIQILFMCGKNKQLYDLVKGLAKILGESKRIKIFPFSFTSRMNLFMRASDLVIGKAGPNTIFESVACGVPFFAVSHISGQEDGNLELIKKYNIGYAEENPIKIAKTLKTVIKNPSLLKRFDKPIQNLSGYNKSSRSKLLEIISSL